MLLNVVDVARVALHKLVCACNDHLRASKRLARVEMKNASQTQVSSRLRAVKLTCSSHLIEFIHPLEENLHSPALALQCVCVCSACAKSERAKLLARQL